jgi:ribosomal-protein-alanine N-acetyltransferase
MDAGGEVEGGVPVLRGSRVLLRRVEERDMRDQLASGHDAEAVRMYGGDYHNLEPFTVEDAERWYQFQLRRPYSWVMEVAGHCVGGIRLDNVNPRERRASLAIGIHHAGMRGQGIGTEAIRPVLRYAFEDLRLHRVSLRVLEYNHRGIAAYEKCGFVREGIERETLFLDGAWHSDVMMSVLEHEYRAIAESW